MDLLSEFTHSPQPIKEQGQKMSVGGRSGAYNYRIRPAFKSLDDR